MSCTCLLQTSNRAISSTFSVSRLVLKAGFSSQSIVRAAAKGTGAKAATTAAASPATPTPAAAAGTASLSSCPAGTVLPGLNFSKTGSDPIAKEDSEYPSWLWTLLSPRKAPASISGSPKDVALFDQKRKMKISSKTAIRARNTLTG
ncbi:BZ3500_MvSof-1268-A1-R1_Chr4-1g06782 [Microbotryum saponariae]|uniref:Large ribosomal subunit protein mL54 n=1 Tax=Microbotryum saponariae TaxID=289078 RepID=A0A2X0LKL2_9BASI|nr:BZ3500_MvSof-1268-A1-R1_Chr4-1g06782 [Microbotryum saponariae]SDA06439.1 BZ3501_MvSof-1269-A2-R1_Chr4-1g06484 [Microbotryum saponariae]